MLKGNNELAELVVGGGRIHLCGLTFALTREQKGAKRRFCESVLNALLAISSYGVLYESKKLAKLCFFHKIVVVPPNRVIQDISHGSGVFHLDGFHINSVIFAQPISEATVVVFQLGNELILCNTIYKAQLR